MIEYIKSPDPYYRIEAMTGEHRDGVIDVLNYFIENSAATFFTDRVEYEIFRRFEAITCNYPSVVVTVPDGRIVGFAFLHAYHPGTALKRAAEITYFLLPGHTGKGLGSAILSAFVEEARTLGVTQLLASITSLNTGSIAFHEKHGFSHCGRFKDIGYRNDITFDVIWMQKSI